MELLIFIGAIIYVWYKVDNFADDINPYYLTQALGNQTHKTQQTLIRLIE